MFIIMELVGGQTLREKKGSISFKQAIDIGIQIADGLAAAHEGKNTIINEKNYTRKFVDIIGNRGISSIDTRLLDQWKSHLLQDVNPTTFNIEKSTLYAILSMAVKWKYIYHYPFKAVKKLKVEQRCLYFTEEELNNVLKLIVRDINSSERTQKQFTKMLFLLILFMDSLFLKKPRVRRHASYQ